MSTTGGVQSVERAFLILELISESNSGRSLTELSSMVGVPAPTTHRLLKTLVALGYARQFSSRKYGLGLGLIRLGELTDNQFAPLAMPHLEVLAATIGESANLAMLDRTQVIYVAQAPSPHPMRMFTQVGHRTFAHSTGVGKAMLAHLGSDVVRKLVTKAGMPAATERTIVDLETLESDLATIRERGYAVDDGEHEFGVRCYAVAVLGLPIPMAISVSGPDFRMNAALVDRAVPQLKAEASALAKTLLGSE